MSHATYPGRLGLNLTFCLGRIDRDTEDQTEVGGYPVKKGTQVMIPVYSIHRDPEHWTDPETFDPERSVAVGGD